MTEQEPIRTEAPAGPRRRVARRIVRLREDVRRYRRLSVGLGGALLLAVAVLATLALRADTPDPVDLGTGVAGVEEPAVPVVIPRDRQPPPPPPPSERHLGEGAASYYSDALEGRRTASGEPYRGGDLTAAHRSLPFGSRVRVSNPANGRSVVVRINDRGPFARHRVIDLSRSAASRLGLLSRGHGRVRLELLN